jgi:hypothetical protein
MNLIYDAGREYRVGPTLAVMKLSDGQIRTKPIEGASIHPRPNRFMRRTAE